MERCVCLYAIVYSLSQKSELSHVNAPDTKGISLDLRVLTETLRTIAC